MNEINFGNVFTLKLDHAKEITTNKINLPQVDRTGDGAFCSSDKYEANAVIF